MSNYKSLIAPLALSVALIVVVTLVEGSWTERWIRSDSQLLATWSARVKSLPMTIGDWEGKTLPENPQEIEAAGITGSVSREYVNRATGDKVSVFLVVGGARKIAVHTPDKCFVAAGYKMNRDPEGYGVTPTSEFYNTLFSKEAVHNNELLRVFWGWNVGTGWAAPAMPRWEYRGKEALCKMYLMTMQTTSADGPDKSAALEFMKEAEPVIQATLFPDVKSTPAASGPAKDSSAAPAEKPTAG